MDLKKHAVATCILLVADWVWIWSFMAHRYEEQVMAIQGGPMVPSRTFIVLAYLLMVIGLNVFVLPRIREARALHDSLKYGLTFGVVLYGVYDSTSAAVLSGWDKRLAMMDVAWGGFVYFLAAYAYSKI